MVWKTIILLSSFLIPYLLILIFSFPLWVNWILTVIMGISVAGIGMSIMHDACHGAYSSNKRINTVLSYLMNFIGGNRFNWIAQHNINHHTYTNIYGKDGDLDTGNIIRLSPYAEWSWYHRFQHIYTWFLYFLGTLTWVTYKDFKEFKGLYKDVKGSKKRSMATELTILIGSKILYYTYMIVIPILVTDIPWYYILIGFITIQMVAGFILTVTFQLAHVVEVTDHEPLPGEEKMENTWIVHQIRTTANFAPGNKVLNWYLGGLNFQVEHHLFPHICHVHYHKLSEIVKNTVEDFGLCYNVFPTMQKAIISHYKTLKKFSQKNSIA